MKAFTRVALISTLATYFLIFTGGLVRVSGAGLGCPDWPKCFGRWMPPFSLSQVPPDVNPAQFNIVLAWIEYTNRIIGMAVGLLILATAILAIVKYRNELRILIPSLLAALLVAYQGWQGGQVVKGELDPFLVSIHLLISFVIVSLLIYVTLQGYLREKAEREEVSEYPKAATIWTGVLWLVAMGQVILGTEIRSGIKMLSHEFPLLPDTSLLARLGILDDTHMLIGVLLLLFTIFAGLAIVRVSRNPSLLVKSSIVILISLVVVQVIIGLVLIGARLYPLLQLFHLWIAGLYIGLSLLLFFGLRYPRGLPIKSQRNVVSLVIVVLVVVAFMGVGGGFVIAQAERSRASIEIYGEVPDFTFTERSGEPFGLDNMRGKINVVDFIFTNCPMICPLMAEQMIPLYQLYKHSEQVQFVSISVDPERDSLPRLREYARDLGVTDNRWVFLRAPTDSVVWLAEDGFMVSGDFPGGHSTKFILVDQEGRIRGYFDFDDPHQIELLKVDIKELARQNQ